MKSGEEKKALNRICRVNRVSKASYGPRQGPWTSVLFIAFSFISLVFFLILWPIYKLIGTSLEMDLRGREGGREGAACTAGPGQGKGGLKGEGFAGAMGLSASR